MLKFWENREITELKARLEAIEKAKQMPKDYQERIAELEIKMAKLWGLLLETSLHTGKEKLSKFGRKFGGASKHLLNQ